MTSKRKPPAALRSKTPAKELVADIVGPPTMPVLAVAPLPPTVTDLHGLSTELTAHASPLSLVHPEPGASAVPVAARKGRKPAPRPGKHRSASVASTPEKMASGGSDRTVRLQTLSAVQAEQATPNPAAPVRPPANRKSEPDDQNAAFPPEHAPTTAEAATQAAGARRPERRETPGASLGADHPAAEGNDALALPDMDAMAQTVGRLIESGGKAAAAYLTRDTDGIEAGNSDVVQTFNSLGRVAESWLTNPARMIEAQAALSTRLFALWNNSLARFAGSQDAETKRVTDKRFAAPEWRETPFFDFLHQAYLVTTDWAKAMVADADNVDRETRDQAAFYLRQITSALSPSNFLATNPELLKTTFKEKGENLVRGMQMLAEDIEAGRGELKIRQSDAGSLKLGVDMASTPGKVVFRNDLMELIQYAPTTERVLKRPLLIVPPWINKFYVLDLNREKSLVRWLVSEGVTVFVISWVNPDARHAQKDWDAYMREGIFAALDAIEQATAEREVSSVGYCVGGTLLAATLAYMASKNDRRITSSTFLTTQVDFKEAGDLKVFADEDQIRTVERQMAKTGYLEGARMANAFNMLRPEDLIWSYSVNTYLKGQPPKPFDLLTWNSDATRMSAANHAFYLRNCYLENNLARGEMVIGGEKLNLAAVTIPIYDLAAKEDHIAPARSVFTGSKLFGGPVRYVMAGSGHIAGVVNPPSKPKYQFWSDGRTDGTFEDWVSSARETPGTWWVDWIEWLRSKAPDSVPARTPGDGGLQVICDAPGEYVRVQS